MERRARAHLETAGSIIEKYSGKQPLSAELRAYFSANKKHGSRDRKDIAHMCYAWFRLGDAFRELPASERIPLAVLLTTPTNERLLQQLRPEWSSLATAPLPEKLHSLAFPLDAGKIFPYRSWISKEIDADAFITSWLTQPDLFLRARPGKEFSVKEQLEAASLPFEDDSDNSFRLRNQVNLENILHLDRDAVVQDLSSQHTLDLTRDVLSGKQVINLWDCCAASGGKTILANDLFGARHITVTDIRETILVNLKKRLSRAAIDNYQAKVVDLSAGSVYPKGSFDLVVCDAPCSGSGTWGRTPEQPSFFKKEHLDRYVQLQKKIAKNAAATVRPGGIFTYITCSVFEEENEGVVDFLEQELQVKCAASNYLKGYLQRADTLFTAVFRL